MIGDEPPDLTEDSLLATMEHIRLLRSDVPIAIKSTKLIITESMAKYYGGHQQAYDACMELLRSRGCV